MKQKKKLLQPILGFSIITILFVILSSNVNPPAKDHENNKKNLPALSFFEYDLPVTSEIATSNKLVFIPQFDNISNPTELDIAYYYQTTSGAGLYYGGILRPTARPVTTPLDPVNIYVSASERLTVDLNPIVGGKLVLTPTKTSGYLMFNIVSYDKNNNPITNPQTPIQTNPSPPAKPAYFTTDKKDWRRS